MTILIKIRPKFPIKLQKTADFSLKPKLFKIFGAFGAENLKFYVPKTPDFLELGSPHWARVPPNSSLIITIPV